MCRYDQIMQMIRDGRTNDEIAMMFKDCVGDDIEVYRKVLEGRTCRLSPFEIQETQTRVRNFPVSEQDIVELYLQGITIHDISRKLHKSHTFVGDVLKEVRARGILNDRDREKLENSKIEGEVLAIYYSGGHTRVKTIAQTLNIEERRVLNILTRRVYWVHTKERKRQMIERSIENGKNTYYGNGEGRDDACENRA